MPATVTTQRAYLAALRGDAEGAASFASRALAEIGEREWMVASIARWNLALAEWLRGRLAEAERALLSTISEWRAVGERGLAAVMRDHLGQVQRAQGCLDAAHGTYQEALAITAPSGGPPMPGAGAAHVGLAELAYERNEFDTALRHVTQGIPLCRQFVYTPPLAAGLATLAWIRQANGDPGGALETIVRRRRAADGRASGRLVAAQKAGQAAARTVPLGCLARVLQAFGGNNDVQGAGRAIAAPVPGLVEQLTARELEILALLAAGIPNPRIAEHLVVSLDTVKKHVSHLLGKLGAANRTEAVTRARQLGLIP